jgi:hypothetical protein
MNYSVWRSAVDGKYKVHEGSDGTGPVVFTHSSENVAYAHMDTLQAPAPVLADLPPHHAALARVEAMQNELIALHVSVWGAYEIPRYGIDAQVRHKPTGLLCVVRGYMAWTPPIVLYSLTDVDGMQMEHLAPLSDIEAVTANDGDANYGK